ncbi:MAG: hypothetical protein ACO28I_13725, partial [Limnohabitans sp.]
MALTPISRPRLPARCQGGREALWAQFIQVLRQTRGMLACWLLGGLGSAVHADWTFLALKDGVTYLVDRNTIAAAGPYKRIWM